MKVFSELNLREFNAWSGGNETKKIIIENDKESDFEYLIEELYPDGIDETKLNDILWFDRDWVLESLGITEEEEENEE